MLELDVLLRRDGLTPEERLLIKIKASVWPGDQVMLATCVQRCRELRMRRELLEETLLQAILFCGFPRVVNAFKILHGEWPPSTPPAGGALPTEDQGTAGLELFSAIYGQKAAEVGEMLLSYHAELHDFVIDTAYGRILSRPGLGPRIRELMAIGILALTRQDPQLVAHGRGAVKFGATSEQLVEAIYTATADLELARDMVRKITAGRG